MNPHRSNPFNLASFVFACILAIGTAACVPGGGTPAGEPSPTLEPTATTSPDESPEPPTDGSASEELLLEPLDPATVAYDFFELRCEARWSSSGETLPCPGDLADIGGGYVGVVEEPLLEGDFTVSAQALLTIPAHEGDYAGIFGHYPRFTVQHGDSFRALLACQRDESPCDASFEIAYFDQAGAYHELPGERPVRFVIEDMTGANHLYLDWPLDPLAGQTVEFVLLVRDRSETLGSRALWIRPYIWRDPTYIPPTTTEEPGIPGVISGMVDMSSAPPYMRDPVVNPYGIPTVVMFFNQDDGTWWWVHNTVSFPYYQMTIPPGDYLVVAYGPGVGGVPYVAAGYTGMNPSCGQPLVVVTMPSNGRVEGIDIADWNWNCGGSAYRPAKPASVPLP